MISSSQKEELLRLAEKATPGPWFGSDHRGWAYPYVSVTDNAGKDVVRFVHNGVTDQDKMQFWATRGKYEYEMANAAYIAACDPQTIIALLTSAAPSREEIKDALFKVSAREESEISRCAAAILALFHKAPTAENTK